MILWYSAYFIACLIVGIYGSDRRFGFLGSFVGSIFATPLIVFLLLIVTKRTKVETQ